ncbi:hypothetical protein Tco_0265640 [Tanacetum coccineum]
MPTEMELTLEQTQQGVSYEVSYDESNTYVLERLNTTAGNPVKKILLKLNLSDHRLFKDGGGDFRYSVTKRLSRSDEVLKIKEIQERCNIKAFQVNKSRKLLKITMSNTSSRNKLNPKVNDHYNIFTRESQEYELKTKDEA